MRFSRTGLLSIVRFVQAQSLFPTSDYPGAQYLETGQHFPESGPVAALFLCSPVQPLEHQPADLTMEFIQHLIVAVDSVVIPVSL